MAEPATEIMKWLKALPPGSWVGVDDGGLTLSVVDHPEVYFEIGGIPDGEDND